MLVIETKLGALFLSSGTTGKPKLISCSYQSIISRFLEDRPKDYEIFVVYIGCH